MTVMNRLWALYRFSLQYPPDGAHSAQVYGARVRVVLMVIVFAAAFGATVLAVTLGPFQ